MAGWLFLIGCKVSGSIIGIILLIVVVIAAIWVFSTYNGFVKKKQAVLSSESGITVELRRRYDMIPALVKTVKGAAEFESSTLEKVIQARNMAMANQDKPLGERAHDENMLTGALKSLFALAEAYPTLTATENYRELQESIEDTEDRIAAGRRLYNLNVQSYMTALQVMPAAIVANMFSGKFPPFEYFEDNNEAINEMPAIDL